MQTMNKPPFQKSTDYTASRTLDIPEHNTTGKLLFVTITFYAEIQSVAAGSKARVLLKSDAAANPTTVLAQGGIADFVTPPIIGGYWTISGIVLPGNYYVADSVTSANGLITLASWIETV